MSRGQRKYPLSQKFETKDIAGTQVILPVVDDLSDEELQQHFEHYLDKEDFEYLEVLVAEAKLRGIRFRVDRDKHDQL